MRFNLFIPERFYASAGSPVNAGGGSGAGSGSGTGTTPPAGTGGAAPPTGSTGQTPPSGGQPGQGPGQQTPPPDPNASDPAYGNWKALRDQLDQARQSATASQTQLATWTKLSTEATGLAKELGYTDADFKEAFEKDPVATLAVLRSEKQQQGSGRTQQRDPNNGQFTREELRNMIKEETAPVSEHVNRQQTEAAMMKYEQIRDTEIKADAILATAPKEVHELVNDYLGEYFATQPEILNAMKTKGDFSAVKEAVKYVSGRMNGAFQAWLRAMNATGGSQSRQAAVPGNQGPGQGGKKFTLDDIINDPSILPGTGDRYK